MMASPRKRKRSTVEQREEERELDGLSASSEIDTQEIFRRHFESQFKPLPVDTKAPKANVGEVPEDTSGDEPDWGGISDEESIAVQIIKHTETQSRIAAMSKAELKAFMASKPPMSRPALEVVPSKRVEDDDFSEASNIKKDLALQRLLAESHLLDSARNPNLSGSNRHKAMELRLQALGSKRSILVQEKMPMAHRKGINAKKMEKERKRRKEAKENGIILANTTTATKNSKDSKRDRGVGAPAVGRFFGGTLKLSKKDISDIQGTKRGPSGGGSRSGGRGRGRGRGNRGR